MGCVGQGNASRLKNKDRQERWTGIKHRYQRSYVWQSCLPSKLLTQMKSIASICLMLAFSFAGGLPLCAKEPVRSSPDDFLNLLNGNPADAAAHIDRIDQHWGPGDKAMLVETLSMGFRKRSASAIEKIILKKTGQDANTDLNALWQHVWKEPYTPHPDYAEFKEKLYRQIDPRFAEYFAKNPKTEIRLDEIRWGGVLRDGIPPLKDPETLAANKATYLNDGDVVFGVTFNGESRAYPKRILAWHEMVKDHVGGVSINGVYCTLCGSMIVYSTELEGKHYELGTSGFLYRSNKLMYDHTTKSMWSTLEGKPVVGPLVGQGIVLKPLYVVTTTWGEWKRRNPDTTVLSLNTGHERNYGEGVAYKDYFSTDRLMFDIPDALKDDRLKNKERILALRSGKNDGDVLALSVDFLARHPVHQQKLGNKQLVILTDPSGASRVYDAGEKHFTSWDGKTEAVDDAGGKWNVTEAALTGEVILPRFPAHEAFWFGWHSAFPKTQLVK